VQITAPLTTPLLNFLPFLRTNFFTHSTFPPEKARPAIQARLTPPAAHWDGMKFVSCYLSQQSFLMVPTSAAAPFQRFKTQLLNRFRFPAPLPAAGDIGPACPSLQTQPLNERFLRSSGLPLSFRINPFFLQPVPAFPSLSPPEVCYFIASIPNPPPFKRTVPLQHSAFSVSVPMIESTLSYLWPFSFSMDFLLNCILNCPLFKFESKFKVVSLPIDRSPPSIISPTNFSFHPLTAFHLDHPSWALASVPLELFNDLSP